jgi:peptidoglycan/xylan/chitin deacetylase (PgdA/CDA1 family)
VAAVTGPGRGERSSLRAWARARSGGYIARRAVALVRRYGITSTRARRRADACADMLARYGTAPVYMVPGRVMARNAPYLRSLWDRGVELGLHSYDHIDLRTVAGGEVRRQMTAAAAAFSEGGVGFDGFRCPYLGYDDETARAIPEGLVSYSSNRAIWRDEVAADETSATSVFGQLRRFYAAAPSSAALALPRAGPSYIEIPCAVPDDLQLFDGLRLDEDGVARAWTRVLIGTHDRGEAFVVLFHPELLDRVGPALERVFSAAVALRPAVWLARLNDIAGWWRERAAGRGRITEEGGRLVVELEVPPRATVLVRGGHAPGAVPWWDGWMRTPARRFEMPRGPRPAVGVAPDVPAWVRDLVAAEGYLVETDVPGECAVRLDGAAVARLDRELGLVEHLERAEGPLVRVWRWPDGARSALAATGDLDALSLVDYAARLVRG